MERVAKYRDLGQRAKAAAEAKLSTIADPEWLLAYVYRAGMKPAEMWHWGHGYCAAVARTRAIAAAERKP